MMHQLGLQPSRAGPVTWYREYRRQPNGSAYPYEYALLSDRAKAKPRKEIGERFILKEKSIGKPSQYPGGKIRKVGLQQGVESWVLSSAQYVMEAVTNVEDYLATIGRRRPHQTATQLTQNCRPEIAVGASLT